MLFFGRQEDFRLRLALAHDALPNPASDRGEQSCCRSGRCCWSGPCQLAPADAPKIAAHLGVTVEALFADSLVVDETIDGSALRVMPRREQQGGGRFLSDDETYDVGPCAFLGADNACEIHAVKPAGGAHYKCWDAATHGEPPGCAWTEEQVKALGWDGDRWRDE